ncbi:MAG: hypothetical protein JW908_11240 [Anaerolineales bacterium]|nr:hypothetical protein [Anaerolineales bacterium]
MEEKSLSTESSQWRAKTLAAGVLVGALVGLGAAFLLIQKAERDSGKLEVGAGEGLKLGLLVLGLLRQISQINE